MVVVVQARVERLAKRNPLCADEVVVGLEVRRVTADVRRHDIPCEYGKRTYGGEEKIVVRERRVHAGRERERFPFGVYERLIRGLAWIEECIRNDAGMVVLIHSPLCTPKRPS